MKLSIVVPCFNEEEALPIFYQEAEKYTKEIPADIEYCFVDDGSRDHTLEEMRRLHEQDKRVHYVSFSRNFGKEAGLLAGLELAEGDLVVTMDVDLQDPPSLLPEMFRIVTEEGYDCAATRRSTRKGEPPVRSWFAHRFYHLINRISDVDIVDGARDFRMMNRKMVNAVIQDAEYNRFSKGLYSWVGFSTKWMEYENVERSAGTTKWSFWKLFRYAIDGIIGYSTAPLTWIAWCGSVLFTIGFIWFIADLIVSLVQGRALSLTVLILFMGGLILLALGIISMYLSKIYLEVKHRPVYIVRERR
jgi:glucosyltransferase